MEVDRFSLERPLAGHMLITHHLDRPGIIGRIGTILGRYEVNIAGMQVGRRARGGEAIMVLNVDDPIPEAALNEILQIPDVWTAYVVSLPESGDNPMAAGSALSAAVAHTRLR
jgi:D-3-phosphoglycerate dehydrogenase